MNIPGRFFINSAAAALLALGVCTSAAAQRTATQVYLPPKAVTPVEARTPEDTERVVAHVTAEANARIRAGQSEDDVEAWLAAQLGQAGMTVKTAPPSWDVFGSAAWELENPGTDSAENREPSSGGIATIDGFTSRNPVDGRYEHSEAKEDPRISDEDDAQETVAGEEAGQVQRHQGTAHSAGGSAGGFFVYASEPGRGASASPESAAPVRLRAGEAAETGRELRSEVDRAAGVAPGLRSGPGELAQAPGGSAAGADTD